MTAAVAAGRGDEETLGRCNEAILSWAGPRRLNLLLATVQETRARAAVGRGDFEEAYQQAAALTPPGRFPAHFPHLQRVFLDLVESAMRTGREPEARAHVDAARRTRMGEISPHHRLLLESAAALVAPDAEAGPVFEAALALPDASSWGWEYARLQLLYGEWLRRRREHTAARRHLSAAAETFDRLGAAVWAQRARQELRAAGVAVRVPSGTALVTMSAQERRIAELAATGLSNKEIGQQLNISPRTAGAHLYRVFPKLGVTTRAALRDALRDLEDDTHLVS
ncbi:response regulator transcription factor [Streptacidiphilus monticola]